MRRLLEESFRAAVAAADPLVVLSKHLPPRPRGRVFVAAAGKAAASMTVAVEREWGAVEGIAITRYGHGLPTKHVKVVEAGHPVPDEAGERAAREILESAKRLGADDLLLVLISGGGSSLLSLPPPGVSMAELKALTGKLLKSGAEIREMNTVRKHLSAIAGGRLAAACRGSVVALIISDVVGDDPTHIASGPCAADPTTIEDAKAILARYRIDFRGPFSESPKSVRAENKVIATAMRSLEAAGEVFRKAGIRPEILGDTITGEAREVGKEMAERALRTKGPAALISGGECTVTIENEAGRGGRCAEFLLSLGLETGGIWAIAADTDGIDGSEDNAGAILTPESMKQGLDGKAFLARHDSYGFFQQLGDLVVTGPTRTNVNDYRAILIL
ncbi:hydroxypyruvate reductase [Betaproteobacteria bacterium SCGC AG-212-J23]|nr:hydroxypyruvate reductase [Betaproteobacteria bacterium SCGC AG-212-J23]